MAFALDSVSGGDFSDESDTLRDAYGVRKEFAFDEDGVHSDSDSSTDTTTNTMNNTALTNTNTITLSRAPQLQRKGSSQKTGMMPSSCSVTRCLPNLHRGFSICSSAKEALQDWTWPGHG